MIHLVSIDNLSGNAYRLRVPRFDHSLRFETPVRVHEFASRGLCDVALLPAVCLPELAGLFEPIGPYGIACRGAVTSVQLFSGIPLEALLRERRPIYATPKSRTSRALFSLLCRREFGLSPVLVSSYPGAAAHLLIGDAAFECAHTRARQAHNVDLGAWWLSNTGLPFVYARWAVSKTLNSRAKADIADWLEACSVTAASPDGAALLARGFDSPEESRERRAYYGGIHTRLTEDDLAGEALFLDLLEEAHHECNARIA